MEMVCGTTGTPTSDCIVNESLWDPGALAARSFDSLASSSSWSLQTRYAARVHCSQHVLTAHSERSTWRATWRVDQPAVFMPMVSPSQTL
ncbi:hypothetical protein AVEN_195206-1 [Araneus ventricosus]|uniref:Uncharacterized protein n=1 Tax=Araneus ventricosus TaxID=182803 RepID=A0A4Y2G2C7_ARAVE|nr:hypothetical protein AVEN_195206-1 [Araneus ventricosus]